MLGASLWFAACGGSSSHSTTSSSAAISIALNPKPSTTTVMVGNSTGIQLTAVVSDDSSNSGVDWAITCPAYTASGASGFQPAGGGGPYPCGTLNIAPTMHTASGKSVTYVPPSYLPSGDTTVTIVAYATADHTQNVPTPVAVNSYTNVLKGTYVLQVQGTDNGFGPNGFYNPFQATGAFEFDGKGNITSGEETYNTVGLFSGSYLVQGKTGTPSTYFIGADGRGTMTLNVQQTSNGATLTQNLSFVVLSSAKALVADLGDAAGSGLSDVGQSGTGTLELQDSTAATMMPTGGYAFVTQGTDSGGNQDVDSYSGYIQYGNSVPFPSPFPTAIGGVINIDTTGSISSTASLADQEYATYNYNQGFPTVTPKLFSCPPASLSGTISAPDSFGSFSLLLIGSSCFGQPPNPEGSIQFTGYIVDSTTIRLIESDDATGTSGFLTAGIAVGQGSSAGTFSNASLSGNYVFGISGLEDNSYNGFTSNGFPNAGNSNPSNYAPSSFTSAGVINADGNGNFSGETDTFFLSGGAPTQNNIPFPGCCFTDTPIRGTYSLDSTSNAIGRASLRPVIFKGNTTPHPDLLFYLTGNGNPALALWADGNDNNFPSVGTGEAYVQALNPNTLTFANAATYGVNFAAVNPIGAAPAGTQPEDNGSGSVSSNNGAWTGTIDDAYHNVFPNPNGNPLPPLSFSGTFATSADSFGRLGVGSFVYNLAAGGPPDSSGAYYMIDDSHAFFVENDWATVFTSNSTLNTTGGQVSLGYFEQACDVTSATSCQAAAQAAKKKPSSQAHRAVVEGKKAAPQR